MSENVKIIMGGGLADIGKRFVDAWHRAEAGDLRQESVISFDSWSTFASLMTEKRVELLKALGGAPAESINALARRCHRDYRNVHADVTALTDAGLIERRDAGLVLAFDAVEARLQFR